MRTSLILHSFPFSSFLKLIPFASDDSLYPQQPPLLIPPCEGPSIAQSPATSTNPHQCHAGPAFPRPPLTAEHPDASPLCCRTAYWNPMRFPNPHTQAGAVLVHLSEVSPVALPAPSRSTSAPRSGSALGSPAHVCPRKHVAEQWLLALTKG